MGSILMGMPEVSRTVVVVAVGGIKRRRRRRNINLVRVGGITIIIVILVIIIMKDMAERVPEETKDSKIPAAVNPTTPTNP